MVQFAYTLQLVSTPYGHGVLRRAVCYKPFKVPLYILLCLNGCRYDPIGDVIVALCYRIVLLMLHDVIALCIMLW